MPKRYVVDYLNVGLVKHLLRLQCGDQVYVVFHSNNFIFETIIVKWLKFNEVVVSFKKFNAKKTYTEHTYLADRITNSFVKKNILPFVNNEYFVSRIGRLYYSRIYRVASILEFTFHQEDLNNIDRIYITHPKVDIDTFQDNVNTKIIFYSSMGYAYDIACNSTFRPFNQNGFIKKILKLLALFHNVFFVTLRSWPNRLHVTSIFHIHPKSLSRKFYRQNIVTSAFPQSGFLDNSLVLTINNQAYNCRRLSLKQFPIYMKHIVKFKSLSKGYNKLPFIDKAALLRDWVNVFYLTNMICSLSPKFFYSNYESNIALQIQTISMKYNCVTVASTYSAGYFPVEFEFTHQVKWADVFFVWGKYLSDLYFESNDKSKQHIISGYVGDYFLDEFKDYSNKNYNFNAPVIAIFDSTFADDLFLSKNDTINFVESIVRYSVNKNAQIIIKTKKGVGLYSDLCKEFPDQVHLDSNPASFSASMNANLVIGYLSSTPCLISRAWGHRIVLYDPYDMIWERGQKIFSKYIVKNQVDLFYSIDESIKQNKSPTTKLAEIDPFSDGHALERISDFLQDLIACPEIDKKTKIAYANKMYSKKNGSNHIIYNKF